MEKTNKYYSIIENLVRQHKKFPGYEPILEEIIDDVYSHSEVIINSINNESVIKAYLEKVISTSIITVPKKLNFKSPSIVKPPKDVSTDLIDKMINGPKQPEKSEKVIKPEITVQEMVSPSSINTEDIADKNELDNVIVEEDSVIAQSVEEPIDDVTFDIIEENNSAPSETNVEEEVLIEEPTEELILTDSGVVDETPNAEETSPTTESLANNNEEAVEPLDFDIQSDFMVEDDTQNEGENIVEETKELETVDTDIDSIFADQNTDPIEDSTLSLAPEVETQDSLIIEEDNEEISQTAEEEYGDITDISSITTDENEPVLVEESDSEPSINDEFVEESIELDFSGNEPEAILEEPVQEDSVLEEEKDSNSLVEEDSAEVIQEPSFDIVNDSERVDLDDSLDLTLDEGTGDDFLVEDNDDTALDFVQETISPLEDDGMEVDNLEELEEINDIEEFSEDAIPSNTESRQVDYSAFNYVPDSDSDDIDVGGITKELLDLNHKRPELNIIKVYELKYKENLSLSDIALQLEMSENSVLEALSEIIAIV